EEVLTRRLNKIALELKTKNYTFKHALKKHGEFISKTVKSAIARYGFTYKNFHVLLNKDKVAGFIAITKINPKISKINALWVDKKERGKKIGYKILKEAISETKSKRIYLLCKQELKDYYLRFGFEEINKIPDEMQKDYEKIPNKKNMLAVVYDKNKHQADESFSQIPNLIIIDGGKGQLKVCTDVMKNLELKIPYIALAKELEEIFIPNKKNSIVLEKNNEALKLLQRIRDEAHRFAITYNKDLRKKRMFH
ncbi:MAG: GNAT family N-acetyltransferase, partial [Candidatus Gracilibacteria bacterium]